MTTEPNSAGQGQTDVYLVGLGVSPIRHMTMEARQVLQRCRSVFVVDHGFAVLHYLRSLGPDVVNLLDEYQEGRHRLTTYQRMAARVIDRALDSPPVAFATYGHPSWLVYPSALISEAAKQFGLNVSKIHGISTIDTVIGDLDIDPGTDGLQIHEATGLVREERQLDPHVPCLLLQVDAYEFPVFSTADRESDRFLPLRDYLLRFYPSSHDLMSIYSPTHAVMKPLIKRFNLADLPEYLARQVISGTLFIDPIKRASQARG